MNYEQALIDSLIDFLILADADMNSYAFGGRYNELGRKGYIALCRIKRANVNQALPDLPSLKRFIKNNGLEIK